MPVMGRRSYLDADAQGVQDVHSHHAACLFCRGKQEASLAELEIKRGAVRDADKGASAFVLGPDFCKDMT